MTRLSPASSAASSGTAAPASSGAMVRASKSDVSLVKSRTAAEPRDDLPVYVSAEEIARARERAVTLDIGAFVGFLWGTGARVSEALAVTPSDLDVEHNAVKLPTLKRRRKDGSGRLRRAARVIPIGGRAMSAVLACIVRNATKPHDPIWPWGRQHAWRLVREALARAGVERGRATPHAIRHGHAVHAIRHGVALNLIQRQLGHSSIVTTAIYLRVTGQDVAEAYAHVPW